MKHQTGFVSVIIILIIISIAVIGGGYKVYKNKVKSKEIIENIQTSKDNDQVNKLVQPAKKQVSNPELTSTKISVEAKTKLNCDNNWVCIISAAKQCQSASSIFSYSNIKTPFTGASLVSGKDKYEIKKSGDSCMLQYSPLSQSVTLVGKGRAELEAALVARGMPATHVDVYVKEINDNLKSSLGTVMTCNSSSLTIASYLADQKNILSGKNVYASEDSNSSQMYFTLIDRDSSQITLATSSGQKLVCTK